MESNTKKTVFLTGGTGFLGGHLGREFLSRGWHVLYLARAKRTVSAKDRVLTVLEAIDPKWRELPGTFELVEGDITLPNLGVDDAVWGEKLRSVDELWHSAAVLFFSEDQREVTEKINHQGTLNVLDFVKRYGIKRLQHISTAYVSGLADHVVMEEVTKCDWEFRNPYEETKYAGEQAVKKFADETGVKTTIYRPAVIIGDTVNGKCLSFTGFYNIAKVFALMKRLVVRKINGDAEFYKKHDLYTNGNYVNYPFRFPCPSDTTVNLIPIDCVVSNIMNLCERPESVGQVYHLTHPNPPKIRELLVKGCQWIEMGGVEFVDCTFEQSEQVLREEVKKFAALGINISFCLEISEYLRYLFGEPVFDVSKIRAALKEKYFEAPVIDEAFLRKILDFGAGCQWHGVV